MALCMFLVASQSAQALCCFPHGRGADFIKVYSLGTRLSAPLVQIRFSGDCGEWGRKYWGYVVGANERTRYAILHTEKYRRYSYS